MKDFTNVIIGDLPIGFFFGSLLIACLAAFGLVLYRATQKKSNKFDWSFFWRDNLLKWFLQILTICFMIRASSALLTNEAVFSISFGIGIASGQFSIWTQGIQNDARK